MKAIVTGAAGFVGSTLSARLLADGHDVVGIDAFTPYYDPALKRANIARLESPHFTLVEGDLAEVDLDTILVGADVVFHEAGQPGVRTSWGDDFATYLQENVHVTQRLLEAARRSSSLKRFVYASSSSVYGDAQQFPTREEDRPAPVSPYGVTKLAAEHLCSLYGTNFGVPTVSLRYFTVYGPRQRPDMAFTRFLRAAAEERPIDLFGTGEQVRDFTFVDDVVAANVRAATEDVAPGTVLNIAGGTNTSMIEVIDIIDSLSGKPLEVRRHPRSDGDVHRTGGDASLARQAIGWKPAVGLEEGLARQWEWVVGTHA